MSKLFYSEQGNIISTLCEELTTFRRARKVLNLPATSQNAKLFLLARPYPGSDYSLRMAVNQQEILPLPSKHAKTYIWFQVPIASHLLREGENIFEFWTDGTAMNAWSLGLESGHAYPNSFISDDCGKNWRAEKMGFQNVVLGEYVVRVRLEEGQDPDPPRMIWEDPSSPRLLSLRKQLPEVAIDEKDLMKRIRILTAWLSTSWAHVDTYVSSLYTPWDAETILAWGKYRLGHDQRLPVTMCVHYAVAFVSSCMALEIPARCVIGTDSINGLGGHFLAEVWFDDFKKWVLVDPNLDMIFEKSGIPLSLDELRACGDSAADLAVWGPGTHYQKRFPHIEAFFNSTQIQSTQWAVHRSIWPRTDFLSHPELSPPAHGTTAYSETNLVWETKDLHEGLGMFPYFADKAYFDDRPDYLMA
jgi:hypothetical protein